MAAGKEPTPSLDRDGIWKEVFRPDPLWQFPELEGLWNRLAEEYELSERYCLLENNLELIFPTARTSLDLLQSRRTLRVEWSIVILIMVEIVISVYELIRG